MKQLISLHVLVWKVFDRKRYELYRNHRARGMYYLFAYRAAREAVYK